MSFRDIKRKLPNRGSSTTIFISNLAGKSTFQGAETEIVAAIDPKYKGSRDIYFSDCKPKQSSRQSR